MIAIKMYTRKSRFLVQESSKIFFWHTTQTMRDTKNKILGTMSRSVTIWITKCLAFFKKKKDLKASESYARSVISQPIAFFFRLTSSFFFSLYCSTFSSVVVFPLFAVRPRIYWEIGSNSLFIFPSSFLFLLFVSAYLILWESLHY